MIAAANATSRAVVVILFGPVVAVWAVVEGMTLLPSKGSGFNEGHVLPLGTFSMYSYRSCDCDEIFFVFFDHDNTPQRRQRRPNSPLNHDEHWRP
jgi:hypothetical protein